MDEDFQLSRPAVVGPFGKLDCEIKTVIDSETLELFDAKAHGGGSDRSKLLRNLIFLAARGKTFDKFSADEADRRTRLLLGEGLELAQQLEAQQ